METLKSTFSGITEEILVTEGTEITEHFAKEPKENEISTHEIEEYFERKGIDIQAGIERLRAVIQKYKLEVRSQTRKTRKEIQNSESSI